MSILTPKELNTIHGGLELRQSLVNILNLPGNPFEEERSPRYLFLGETFDESRYPLLRQNRNRSILQSLAHFFDPSAYVSFQLDPIPPRGLHTAGTEFQIEHLVGQFLDHALFRALSVVIYLDLNDFESHGPEYNHGVWTYLSNHIEKNPNTGFVILGTFRRPINPLLELIVRKRFDFKIQEIEEPRIKIH